MGRAKLKKNVIAVVLGRNQRVVCTHAEIADTFRTRLVGLLGKRTLDRASGLLIHPSSGVHTFGMSMAIDIVCLDRRGRVLQLHENVGPWKMRGVGLTTRSVLELAAGRIQECGIECGDELTLA